MFAIFVDQSHNQVPISQLNKKKLLKFHFKKEKLRGNFIRSNPDVGCFSKVDMVELGSYTFGSGLIYRVAHFQTRTQRVDFLDGFLNAHELRSMIDILHQSSVQFIHVSSPKSPK